MAALYAIERQAGFSIQANLLTVWIAATTYFTAGLGALAFLLSAGGDLTFPVKSILASALPLPACALAGYHLISAGIGFIRSRSIELLEQELVNSAPHEVREDYLSKKIGSRSETAWTDLGNGSILMLFTSVVTFLVPYLAAAALSVACFYFIESFHTPWWPWRFKGIYGATLALILIFGILTLVRRGRPSKPGIIARLSKLVRRLYRPLP